MTLADLKAVKIRDIMKPWLSSEEKCAKRSQKIKFTASGQLYDAPPLCVADNNQIDIFRYCISSTDGGQIVQD